MAPGFVRRKCWATEEMRDRGKGVVSSFHKVKSDVDVQAAEDVVGGEFFFVVVVGMDDET